MIKLKSAVLAALVAVSPFATSAAFAGHYEMYVGGSWVSSGTASLKGPTTASPVNIPIACDTAIFKLTIPSAAPPAQITAATFSSATNTACASITKVLPWNVSAPSPATGSSGTVTISNVNIHFASPNTTCTGSISGPLSPVTQATSPVNNTYGFTGSLGPCTSVKSTANPPPSGPAALKSDTPIRWVP